MTLDRRTLLIEDEMLFLQNVENVTLKLANKMFIGKDFPVKPQYKRDLQTYYHSDIQSVDFAKSQEAANTVNTWCKKKTNNRIDNIITAGKQQSIRSIFVYSIYIRVHYDRKCHLSIFCIDTNNLVNKRNIYISVI